MLEGFQNSEPALPKNSKGRRNAKTPAHKKITPAIKIGTEVVRFATGL
jgi:hypothetical protein